MFKYIILLVWCLLFTGCGLLPNGSTPGSGSDRWTGYKAAVDGQRDITIKALETKQVEFKSYENDKPTFEMIMPDGAVFTVDVAPAIRAACGNQETPNYGLKLAPIKPPQSAFAEGVGAVGSMVRDALPWVAPVLIIREAGNLNNGDTYNAGQDNNITDSNNTDNQKALGDSNSFSGGNTGDGGLAEDEVVPDDEEVPNE